MSLGGANLPAVVILLALLIPPGYAIWLAAGRQLRPRVNAAEAAFLILTTSIVVVSWLGLVLAEIGRFSLPLLMVLVLGITLLLVGRAVRKREQLNPFAGTAAGWLVLPALVVVCITLILSPRPYQYIVGGRDHGIYVNTGIHIARSGGILIYDSDLEELPAESRQSLVWPEVSVATAGFPGPWSQGQRLSGLTIRDLDQGIVAPHAFHLYPVWIAIFYAAGGLPFALATTMVFSLLAAIALFLAGWRLLGWPTALLALVLLSINVTQVWFTQYPSAEILVRFFMWGGLLAFTLLLTSRSRYAAFLAGFCFGLLHLTKLDTVFVPVILLLYFLYLWLTQRFRREHWYFVVPYLSLLIHTAIHAFFVATIYFIDHAVRVLLPPFLSRTLVQAAAGFHYPADILTRLLAQNWELLLASAMVAVGLFLLGRRYSQPIAGRLHSLERLAWLGQGVLAVSLGLLAVGAFLTYPGAQIPWLSGAGWSLTMTSWYLSPLGLFLGIVGMLQVWITYSGKRSNKEMTFAWLFLLANMLPLFVFGAGTAPDHFWAVRRFVPVVIPALLLFAADLIWQLRPRQAQNWGQTLLPIGLSIALISLSWKSTRPAVGVVEYEGLVEQITRLAGQFPPDAVLLFERSDASGRIATPLWLAFEQTVFVLEDGALDDDALEKAIDQWQMAGRDVYWITTSGRKWPSLEAYAADYISTFEIAVPLFEQPRDHAPNRVGSFRAAYDAYRLVPHSQETRQATTLSFTTTNEERPAISGLYAPFWLPGLTPRIWTAGEIRVDLPLNGRPEKLLLRLENGRPPDIPAPAVDVYLEGIFLGTANVAGGLTIYELQMPADNSFAGETAELRLEMDTWVPAQTGHGEDRRELGVYLDWVKLVVTQ